MDLFSTSRESERYAHAASVERGELARQDCFLCNPAVDLVIARTQDAIAIAGLGPITDPYVIVASREHIFRFNNENEAQLIAFSAYASSVRRQLVQHFGSCVMTEHGNMAVCSIEASAHVHCFHPHFLLFPGAPSIYKACSEYFGASGHEFADLEDALRHGAPMSQYLLISERENSHFVFEPQEGLPRQFSRGLVADALGREELASWRNQPQTKKAMENAVRLRALLQEDRHG